jgi:hypothetical protein
MATAKKAVAAAKKVAKKVAVKKVATKPVAKKVAVQKVAAKTVAKKAPAKTLVVKQTKLEKAAIALATAQRDELLYRMTSVLVPIWFGNMDAEKAMKGPQMRIEAAICLMFIGSSPGGISETGIAMNMRRSSFDRREAMLLGLWGMASLEGQKLGKWVGKRDGLSESECNLQRMVLTAKGQKVFDTTRRSILSGFTIEKAVDRGYV